MKSVLVIDKPDCCRKCPCAYFTEGAYENVCQVTHTEIEDYNKILDDCPLRNLPQREVANEYDFEHYRNGVAIGWNRCLEKIIGTDSKGKNKTEA